MPVFAFTAGSIGDIQGLVGLVIRVGTVLYDAKDTSQDYKILMDELASLLKLAAIVESFKDTTALPPESIESLNTALMECQKCIKDFLRERGNQSIWKKVTWAVVGS